MIDTLSISQFQIKDSELHRVGYATYSVAGKLNVLRLVEKYVTDHCYI